MLPGILKKNRFSSYEDMTDSYGVNVPENFNFARDVVDKWAGWDENKPALVWLNDSGDRREFTFGDMSSLSIKAANYFKCAGIGKGDNVMLMLSRRWEYWVCAVALHRLGAVLIPASIQLTAKDIAYRVKSADIKALICLNDDYVIKQAEEAAAECDSLRLLASVNGKRDGFADFNAGVMAASDESVEITTKNGDIMLIYFTSGTTGMPKMAAHDFTYPLGHVSTAKLWHRCEDGGVHLTVSDSGWAKFGWGCIYGQWICGSAILGYDMAQFDAARLIDVIRSERPTTVCVPPTIYRFMMRQGLSREDFSSVRHCSTAGEPLSPEVHRQFAQLTGLEICEGFGQSESSVMLGSFEWFAPRAGSMGKPSPLYDIAAVDENGDECPVGQEGEVVVRGVDKKRPLGLFMGYYDNGNVAPCYDERGNYRTGDMAWKDERGYYWFVGRNDDMIKCSGYRIGPFEIESVLLTHPAVLECAITGAPDPVRGQVVKASIVLCAGYEPGEELTKEIQQYVKKMTAPYKYPRVIEYVPALPKTTSGKISRARIRS